MVRKQLIDKIADYASFFVLRIKSQSAMNYHDLNIHAENAYIPILNNIFDLKLINTNQLRVNHPAIDLVDDKNGIAFQITATATQDKIIKTLEKFIDHKLHEQYPTLYIYILTEKKSYYSAAKIRNVLQGKLNFDVNTHIIDYQDILRRINYINSLETLFTIANFYEQLSAISSSQLIRSVKNQQKWSDYKIGSQFFADRTKAELKDVIGTENVDKIPGLPELFQKIELLDEQILKKQNELDNCQKALAISPADTTVLNVLTKASNTIKLEHNDLKQVQEQEKSAVNALIQNIRRQKDFLDKMDQQQASKRMKEAKRLFEEGEYTLVNALLNYEGRQEYIQKKLEEKEIRSAEWSSLANEEVLVALSILQKQDWHQNTQQIKTHFEQSIELGGYGLNAYQYSLFLEDINQQEQAIDILDKIITRLPVDHLANKALVWARLGYLLTSYDEEKAFKAYAEAATIYELLFTEEPATYRFVLADTSYSCGKLLIQKSLDQARGYLERALLLLGNMEKPGNVITLKLTFITIIALGYLHQQQDDGKQTVSYLIIALEIGAMLAIDEPDDGTQYLLEAIDRIRKLFGEEKEEANTALFYQRAFNYFLKFHQELSQNENYHHANALIKAGLRLLAAQEIIGADICFRNALKIFRRLEKNNYSCLPDIANALGLVGFIYMTKNKVKARKKVLSEALDIRKRLAETDPIEHLPKVASLLDELYINSFIAVSPSLFFKANPLFDEALEIYKQLDKSHKQPDIHGWLQLYYNTKVHSFQKNLIRQTQ